MNIGLAQITSEPYDVEDNRALTLDAARSAFEQGANVVVLPELSITGYVSDRERLMPLAERVDGTTSRPGARLPVRRGA